MIRSTRTRLEIDSNQLQEYLRTARLRQWQLASDLGYSPAIFSQYITGRVNAPYGLRAKIAEKLGISEESLLPKKASASA